MESSNNITMEMELELVVKSLRMDTSSKLTYSDSIKFDALVRDIFPGVSFETSGYEFLVSVLEESCVDLGIEVNRRQVNLEFNSSGEIFFLCPSLFTQIRF